MDDEIYMEMESYWASRVKTPWRGAVAAVVGLKRLSLNLRVEDEADGPGLYKM